ncbi:T9SS type A sorting domain-containing protein [Xanthomarina sp. F2636L]|uniref:T9SS type A sorting domain-containing protein n=1 Tax=Xanthomarina sp. F2636L TaxID=2996018 RepID=UPI00225E2F1B|nr:T9SS type A sorting domain-containing protein [Xanthomarina sp. F2636L]MCX7551539.1 T9SS type A sorting domain-containing protein [Xanthomarina sp. F2636L]
MQFKITKVLLNKMNLLLLIALLFSMNLMAQKPMPVRDFEISLEADEKVTSEIKSNMRLNLETGLPIALYGLNYEVPQGTPETMAMYYITNESERFGIKKNEIVNLHHHATRTTNAGSVVRYRQYSGVYPVNKAELTITISPQNKVVYVMNSYEPNVNMANVEPSVTEEGAYQMALDYLDVKNAVTYNDSRLMVYKNTKIARLAYEITILTSNPLGEWHVFVDARTGEIFKVADMAHYNCDHKKGNHNTDCNQKEDHGTTEVYRRAVGTGMVFNPDPLSSNTVVYGTSGYVDGNDANTPELEAARVSVVLNDITQTGSTYSLVGPRAEIIDFDAPNTGLFTQNSSDFNFTRDQQGFEAVNVYYHIDYLMDYINNTLGSNIMPYQYAGGVQFDPHGANGADNSYYTSGAGRLAFGEGCVDDAEDSDVIHHELGHGLHDWVTSGGLSQVNGLSEGSGDYVAQSYNRGVSIANGYWTSADAAWNYVFNWDGHNTCWNGRITNYSAVYPGGLTGSIHTDGQIWASCLMTVWDEIGQQRMDKIFYEGLGMTNSSSNQNDAAVAVYQAAINLNYTTTEINDIHAGLSACGYTLPALDGPPVAAFSADNESICLDLNNTVNFMDETSPNGTSWAWTFEGGTPATSTAQNPTVTYAADGSYDVTLVVTNAFGSDTLTLTDYISVVSGAACPSCNTATVNPNTTISTTGGISYTSTIVIAEDAPITDVNVTINITHTWDADLDIFITSPLGTIVELTSDNGGSGDNYINTVFDMDGVNGLITAGTPPFTGSYIPEGNLNDLNGELSAGNWVLTVVDDAGGDGGTWNSWSLELCTSPTVSIAENTFEVFSIFPNPNNGEFTIHLNSTSNKDIHVQVYDLRGRTVFNKTYLNSTDFNQVINMNKVQSGLYLVKVNDGERQTIQKIIVE